MAYGLSMTSKGQTRDPNTLEPHISMRYEDPQVGKDYPTATNP